jgi:hypothetical protein
MVDWTLRRKLKIEQHGSYYQQTIVKPAHAVTFSKSSYFLTLSYKISYELNLF